MPAFLENLNMDFFEESEESYVSLLSLVGKEGKRIYGYYNLPYWNAHLGDAQIIMRTAPKEQDQDDKQKELFVAGLDTHSIGSCVWEVLINGMNIDRKNADRLSKRLMVTEVNNAGTAVVNLVNADVLPSFLEGDTIKMQMIALPGLVEYYKDEEDYAAHQPDDENGKKWLIGEKSVIATGMLRNRSPQSSEFESNENLDDITAIRGIVKALYWGKIKIGEESQNAYLRCIIDTSFGELEIVHTVEQVEESLRCNMKVGATVVMYGTLSGDVAIYEYEKGIVRDEENNLAAMRYVFSGNDPERIRSILSKDVIYQARDGKEYRGADAVIERIKYVQRENPNQYFAHFARISSVEEREDKTEYSAGKRCLVLALKEETNYESLAFFDYDTEGNICRIVTTADSRYNFEVQTPPLEDDKDGQEDIGEN